MFDGLDALPQSRLVVVRQDRHGFLGHDRAAIERGIDEVDGHTRDRDAGRERVADRMPARERRQQRRMDVDDPPVECLEDARPDHAHVASEHDDIRAGRGERLV